MSSYREYPPPELRDALEWLDQVALIGGNARSRECAQALQRHLQEQTSTYRNYVTLCQLREGTKARNELAKDIFARTVRAPGAEAKWSELARCCLAAADIFLEQSGEKKVVVEEVEEALREVLGWKP